MSRTIRIGLCENDVDRALGEVNAYKRELTKRAETLRKRVAERIAAEARNGFATTVIDDILPAYGASRAANVTVTVDGSGNTTLVVASGEDAVWAEFGSGVYHNGGAGSSPHPRGAELGFTIGSYGEGHGKQNTWGYYGEDGTLVLTHGTPATMPMYRALQTVCGELAGIAKEVYGV